MCSMWRMSLILWVKFTERKEGFSLWSFLNYIFATSLLGMGWLSLGVERVIGRAWKMLQREKLVKSVCSRWKDALTMP